MKDLTPVMFLGIGKFAIDLSFEASGNCPSLLTLIPRYMTSGKQKTHLFGLSFKPACINRSNILSMRLRCSGKSLKSP